MMQIEHISFGYGDKLVLHDLSLEIKKGKITTILGQNGSGKSTLFQLLTRNRKGYQGTISLDGKNLTTYKRKEFAKKVAVVSQYNTAPHDITVRELVAYGRTPHQFLGKKNREEDQEAVDWALEVTKLTDLQEEVLCNLSGGQQQRVWIAMALAQKTELIFLDEPTTYLDVHYQIELLQLVKELNQQYGITIVMILHDINQAVHYSDYVITLKQGKIITNGPSEEVVTSAFLKEIYDVELDLVEFSGKNYVLTI